MTREVSRRWFANLGLRRTGFVPAATGGGVILALSTVFCLLAAAALAESAAAPSCDRNELWIINTRCAPSCGDESVQAAEPQYERYDAEQGWVHADAADFFDSGSTDVPTSFFIHGNRVNSCEAVSEGRSLYRVLNEAAHDRPFRLVIWSWPASPIRGRIRDDVRIKAARSDVQAYYLARCVDRMRPDVPVAMLGHSFGARVITGSLHLLAGGELRGRALRSRADRSRRGVRAVLIAAAVDNGWLLPNWRNGLALEEVDQMLITQNCSDRVLRWYPLMYGRGGPEALGATGPACPSQLGENRGKLEVLGVDCSVGRGHGWCEYLCSGPVRSRLASYAFLAETSAVKESRPADELPALQSEPSAQPQPASGAE
ncbi:MAG TPA: hypothetical protein VJL29_12070 [Thermoguttaceae bacterium]|nr:hypothetical protein [Thermoguttaceae bacterium]